MVGFHHPLVVSVAQSLRVLLDVEAREVLRAIAVAVSQLGSLLLPSEYVQAVIATGSALPAMEHGPT